MKTLSKVALLVLGAVAGGCTTLTTQNAAKKPEAPVAAKPAENFPAVDLSSDLLYRILLGEIAGQRGNLDLSAESYLRAATQTRDPRLARRATQVALVSHNFDVAMRASRLWVELSPGDADAHQALGALLIHAGQPEQALVQLRDILKLVPNGGDHGYLVVARLLATETDKPRAYALMQRLVDESGKSNDALYAYAFLAAQTGASDKALALLDGVLARTPDSVQALVLRAAVLTQVGRKDEALAGYAKAVDLDADNANLRLAYARELITANRLKEAREQFGILARKLPSNSDVIYAKALLAAEAGDNAEAEEDFEQLLKLGQRANEAAFNLGQLAEKRGDDAKAMEWYRSMSADGASWLDGQFRYAMLLAKKSGPDAALGHMQKLDVPTAERAKLVLFQGELLREADRYKEAMALYDAALSGEFARNHDLLYARAMVAEKLDRIDILERDLKVVIFEDPENAQALNALGYTLAERTDRLKEAKEFITRALAKEPEDPAILDSMGWVLYREGHYAEALDYLRRALAKNPDGEIAGHLGAALWRLGKQDEARQVWDSALKTDSPHKALQAIIDQVTGK